jgi:hypothetical protein
MSLEYGLRDTEIAKYTGIRPRTMRSFRKRFREIGEVVKKPVVSGRPRLLNSLDAMVSDCHLCSYMPYILRQFLEGLVERQPDITMISAPTSTQHFSLPSLPIFLPWLPSSRYQQNRAMDDFGRMDSL